MTIVSRVGYAEGVGYYWLLVALERLEGVEPYEVSQALAAARRMPRPAVSAEGIRVLTIWARTLTGRALLVVVRQTSDWDWLILGARDLRPNELAEFMIWEEETR
jgi:hypothetical protein